MAIRFMGKVNNASRADATVKEEALAEDLRRDYIGGWKMKIEEKMRR